MKFKVTLTPKFNHRVARVDLWGYLFVKDCIFPSYEEAVSYIKSQLKPIYYP